MASDSDALTKKTDEKTETVNSPERPKVQASVTQARRTGRPSTERPTEPIYRLKPIASSIADSPIGNPLAINAIQAEGQLGVFYDRADTTRLPTLIDINMDAIRGSASRMLREILLEKLVATRTLDTETMTATANAISQQIANGICVLTYMKLRLVNYFDHRVRNRYRKKPRVIPPFEVPLPYALAISQLGMLKLSGEPQEIFVSPTVTEGTDNTFGVANGTTWSPILYSAALEQAKLLGLQTTSVDLTVKMGSSWWLYRPSGEGNQFRLECPYNEENFTANTAVLASLFCNNAAGGFNNPIIDLGPLGNKNVGSMLYGMTPQMARNTFHAISAESKINFRIGN